MSFKKTLEDFKKELYFKNPDLEVLGKEYINNNTKIKIRCNKHKYEWDVLPRSILSKSYCPICSGHYITDEIFKERIAKLNPNLEVLGEYQRNYIPLKVKCKRCNRIFEIVPMHLLNNCACPVCDGKCYRDNDYFVEEMEQINKNIEITSPFEKFSKKVKCKCKICEFEWETMPQNLLNRHGCPQCAPISFGEDKIKKVLIDMGIKYIWQYKFDDCKDKFKLPFDFYLPDFNMCIEYDGQQHFTPIKHFGGQENFEKVKKHDNIKNNYCQNNGIKLLRISYREKDKIEEILKEKLT